MATRDNQTNKHKLTGAKTHFSTNELLLCFCFRAQSSFTTPSKPTSVYRLWLKFYNSLKN